MSPYTGGPLNKLNGKCGVSNPKKSVHIMSLIRNHNPSTPAELESLIEHHHTNDCECGVSSGGKIEDFGQWLYDAQEEEWEEKRFTLQECTEWVYDLFILQSLKGHSVEGSAKKELSDKLDLSVEETTQESDDEFRVDLKVEHGGELVAGVQVKPQSYKQMRSGVKWRNYQANDKYEAPVYYLFYNYDDERFTNLEDVVYQIENGSR